MKTLKSEIITLIYELESAGCTCDMLYGYTCNIHTKTLDLLSKIDKLFEDSQIQIESHDNSKKQQLPIISSFHFEDGVRFQVYSDGKDVILYTCNDKWMPKDDIRRTCPQSWSDRTPEEYHLWLRKTHEPDAFVPEHSTKL